MSRTIQNIKGTSYPAKTRKKLKDKKHFGFTDGVHSKWEDLRKDSPVLAKGKSYPEKNIDFIKSGYGNKTKKENRVKNFKKEL